MNSSIVRLNPLLKTLASRSAPVLCRGLSCKPEDICTHTGQVLKPLLIYGLDLLRIVNDILEI